jgi:hypothetical protein
VPPHYRGFTITLRVTTLRRNPLDEGSARYEELYLATNNTFMRYTSMLKARFETAISASERPQTHALDRAANGIGINAITESN